VVREGSTVFRDSFFALGGGCVGRQASSGQAFKGIARHDCIVESPVVFNPKCLLALRGDVSGFNWEVGIWATVEDNGGNSVGGF